MYKHLTALLACCLVAASAGAATFVVTKTSDDAVDGCDADCSLREAVIAANATAGSDTIVVPAGTYVLTLAGAGEDAAETGDLDLLDDVLITGDPRGRTVIDGELADRLVHLGSGTATLRDLVMTRGRVIGDWYGGGAILVESGWLTLERCVVSDSVSDAHAGGIFSIANLTVDRSAIVGNTGSDGGGIYHAGSLLQAVNSTVSGNTSTTYGSGGIGVDGIALATEITHCTISDNTGAGSSALTARSPLTVYDSILDGSCDIDLAMGSLVSLGGNLESPADTCYLDHATDQVNVDPADLALGPLEDNGGTTPTRALLSGSVAIDAANPDFNIGKDQRDFPRLDEVCDSGAFEYGADVVFSDGFESGDTTRWSAWVP